MIHKGVPIDHMAPHKLDQNQSIPIQTVPSSQKRIQTTCNCKLGYHDSYTLWKGLYPVPMSIDFIAS
jgi:hypothetical protein